MNKNSKKPIIYQVLPRLFGNMQPPLKDHGSIKENGSGKLADFTPEALGAIRELGATHVWYTGILEHATRSDYSAYGIPKDHNAVVKGKAGSPYAVKDYYDVAPDLAVNVPDRMAEFEALVERTHKAGLKVIIDFVPNHVARQYHSDAKDPLVPDLGQDDDTNRAFAPNNNFYYLPGQTLTLHFGAKQEDFEYSEFPAKATGNDCFSASPGRDDWYETVKLNYGVDILGGRQEYFQPVPDTWHKMLAILRFWIARGVDGFRCDMAEMVPVAFWQWVIPRVKSWKHVLFIAEVYNPHLYRDYIRTGGFDYLYDKVGLYDTLRSVVCGHTPASRITECWQTVNDIRPHMLSFLENHDEQRIASDFFAGRAEAGIPALIVAATLGTGPVMIYFGQELGERGMDAEGFSGRDGRTSIFDYWSLDTLRRRNNGGRYDEALLTDAERSLLHQYTAILHLAREEKALTEGTFFDLMYVNPASDFFDPARQYAYLRKADDAVVLIAVNFADAARRVRIRIPETAFRTMSIPDNAPARLTDLLTGAVSVGTLTHACAYEVELPPLSGRLLKFDYGCEA